MPAINNETASDIPYDFITEGHAVLRCRIQAETGDLRVNIGADAGDDAGTIVHEGETVILGSIFGQRVSVAAIAGESSGDWSGEPEDSESESEDPPTIFAKFNWMEQL